MRYDHDRKRIICLWKEPVRIVMNKKKGCIHRTRMITVKVNDNGKLSRKDLRRHESHPLLPTITRFNSLLNDLRSLENGAGQIRSLCGMRDTFPLTTMAIASQ